ncbi:hypothetical protein C8N25_107110 [Algoriphagus antarcticus]|uniref:Uncharacterized protein n=1 Tax=Algoriphagus antarcticus TaxID=238540 RepID=A0A3E0DWN2_9BACT|nr:hypothetical protein C8N25_107110 [Algoriphagus antarcticus]
MSATRTVQIYDLLHDRLANSQDDSDNAMRRQRKTVDFKSLYQNIISDQSIIQTVKTFDKMKNRFIRNYISPTIKIFTAFTCKFEFLKPLALYVFD